MARPLAQPFIPSLAVLTAVLGCRAQGGDAVSDSWGGSGIPEATAGSTGAATDGVLATSCAPCEGEEPLECVEACDEGDLYEAECIDDAWDCGDGELLESCTSTCGDEPVTCLDACGGASIGEASCTAGEWSCAVGTPQTVCEFPCGTDPWPCVPSCDVFEIYDAVCMEGSWSCGDGMLAADC